MTAKKPLTRWKTTVFEAHKMGIFPSLTSKVSWAIAVYFMGTKQLSL